MAHCSDRMPGVEIIQFEEFDDWHKCTKVFDHYDIQFVLPHSLGIKYQPGDELLERAFLGDVQGLQAVCEREICNYRDKGGNTLLTLASHSDQLNAVRWLCDRGVSVNQKSDTGVTPVLAAAAKNHVKVVDWLINNDANVNDYNDEGFTPLLLSSYNGDESMVAKLIQSGGLINWEDNSGKTPLMTACQRGHVAVVKQLVSANVNVLEASHGPPAPFYAAVTGNSSCLSPLVQLNKKILGLFDTQGWSLLAAAAFHGNLEFVQEMYRLGADLDTKDKFGRTALMAAAEMGHYNVAHFLVKKKASVNIRSNCGASAFYLALSEGYTDITGLLVKHLTSTVENKSRSSNLVMACRAGDIAVTQCLLKGGSSINQKNGVGVTPLIASCMSGNVALLAHLLKLGADVNLKTINNINAYEVAYLKKDYECLKLLEPYFAAEITTLCCHIPVAAACLGDIDVLRNLIQRGEAVHAANSNGVTPVMVASHYGHRDIVGLLLENNGDVSAENEGGATALSYAIEANNCDMIDFLVGHGASVNKKNSQGLTMCHRLTISNQPDLLRRVVHFGGDINCQNQDGLTPLMLACQQGSFDLVKYFVSLNVDINKRCANDYDAINYAFMNDLTEICTYLTEAAANKKPKSRSYLTFLRSRFGANDDESPFFRACIAGELSLVKDLCAAGQNIHVMNNGDINALHYAAYHGHADLAQWLLDNGALINSLAGDDGLTPLMVACHEAQEDIVELLIGNKCLINLRDKHFRSALFFIVTNEKTSLLRLLLRQNLVVDLVDGEGNTPLNHACLKGFLDIVMLLIQNHANIHRTDAYGRTPLMAAARNGHSDIVEFMIQEGADLGIKSGDGKTAADYALENNHKETSDLINDTALLLGVPLLDVITTSPSSGTAVTRQDRFFTICESGQEEHQLMKLLDGEDVDINGRNSNGETGLLLAVMGGHRAMINILLSRDADINTSSNNGITALMFAVESSCMDVVVKLAEKGADLEIRDQFGNDIFTMAAENENQEMLQYLIRKREQTSSSSRASASENVTTSGKFLEDVVQGDIHSIPVALQNFNEIPADELSKAINYAVLSSDSEMLKHLIKSSFHLLHSHTLPLMMCIEQNKRCSLDICLQSADMDKLDFSLLLNAASRLDQVDTVKRLIHGNGNLSRQVVKSSLLENLGWAQYEVLALMVQRLTHFDSQSECQDEQPLFGELGEYLMVLHDNGTEYILM